MAKTAVPIRANGAATVRATGAAALVEAGAGDCCCDCCAGPCCPVAWTPYVQAGTGKPGGDLLRFAWDGEPAHQPWEPMYGNYANGARGGPNPRRCRRLLVYEGVTIAGDAIAGGGANVPDHVLSTNAFAARAVYSGGVLVARLPFETSVGSGVDLDTAPYWFETCAIGGFADVTESHWHTPTLAEIEGRRATCLADGTWRYLILVSYVSYKFADGTYGIPVNKGSARLLDWMAERTA